MRCIEGHGGMDKRATCEHADRACTDLDNGWETCVRGNHLRKTYYPFILVAIVLFLMCVGARERGWTFGKCRQHARRLFIYFFFLLSLSTICSSILILINWKNLSKEANGPFWKWRLAFNHHGIAMKINPTDLSDRSTQKMRANEIARTTRLENINLYL